MHFDIILPTIGRESLATAINSVFQQTHQDWILYVVQDGLFIPNLLALYNDRVQVISTLSRGNDYGANARNVGMTYGTSGWIAYIDDDDVWLPNHLTILSEQATLRPETNMLRTAGQSFSWRHKSPRSSKLVRKLGPVNTQDILTVGMAHTRELFQKTSGWQPCDNHDRLLWADMLAAGGVAATTETVTFEFER